VARGVKGRAEKTAIGEDSAHALVKQQFMDSEDQSLTERTESEVARDYYDGKQWTDAEVKKLSDRGQPVITDNKLRDKIEFMLGLERKGRTDPKAYPRNFPTDEMAAEGATDALRFVCDTNQWDFVRSAAAENIFIEGRGALDVCIDKKQSTKYPKIVVRKIAWDRFYVDPHSVLPDYSDAAFIGVITWMDYDEAAVMWPERTEFLDATLSDSSVNSETYEDRPIFFINAKNRKRVQVFEHYYKRRGQWWYCKFVAAGFLEDPVVSPYLDSDTGEPMHTYVAQALAREPKTGRAYGMGRRLKDLQDEWNKRRSKALHLLNVNQIHMEDGSAGTDAEAIERLRKEAARPDGVLSFLPGLKYDVVNGVELAQAQIQLMLLTGQALQTTGPNAALAGLSGELSGKAKQLDQQGGLVAIDSPLDAVKYMSLRVYRKIWHLVKQFWNTEMWIRVRDEEHVKFIGLNRRVLRGEIAAEALRDADMPDEVKQQKVAEIAADPEMQQEIVLNNIAEIDVDIAIDVSPDVMALQQEEFGVLAEVSKGRSDVPFMALIEASSLRSDTKRRVREQMSGANDPAQQKMAEMEAKMAELEVMVQTAIAAKTMAQAKQAEAAAAESKTDAAVKVAEFLTGANTPAEKQVRVS
jgi:hypothetical protein